MTQIWIAMSQGSSRPKQGAKNSTNAKPETLAYLANQKKSLLNQRKTVPARWSNEEHQLSLNEEQRLLTQAEQGIQSDSTTLEEEQV